MGALQNARHERFAQEVAAGKGLAEAYALAGYAGRHASRLRRHPAVAARVAELQEAVARRVERREAAKEGRSIDRIEISVERLTEMLVAVFEQSCALKQMGAAVSALEKLGKLHGLFVDRSSNVTTQYIIAHEPVRDPEEWLRRHRPN